MKRLLSFVLAFLVSLPQLSFACGDFLIQGPSNTWVNGRSLEFAIDLKSQIVLHPRFEKRSSTTPQGNTSLQWTSKYGFVGLNGFGLDLIADGLNEKGLSVGALWLPGTQYADPKANDPRAILLNDFPTWLLGNFGNIDEVKQNLEGISVWAKVTPEVGMILPVHLAVHDAQGKSIVIEFIRGKMVVWDNPLGVLTNAPTLDKQLKNLEKYKNLTNLNQPKIVDGQTVNGSGMLGIPGDWTPLSRFVRLAIQVKYALTPATPAETANLAFHILNTEDISRGILKTVDNGKPIYEWTQWVVVKDLSLQRLYVRPYENLKISYIDLKQIPWDKIKKQKSMGLNAQSSIPNVTAELLKI